MNIVFTIPIAIKSINQSINHARLILSNIHEMGLINYNQVYLHAHVSVSVCVYVCLIMLISLTSRCLRIVCFTDDLQVWELGLCCHTRRQKR